MPTDYRCSECDLRLCLGSYHYGDPRFRDIPFGLATRFVCSACGTAHAVGEDYLGQGLFIDDFGPTPARVVHAVRKLTDTSAREALALARDRGRPVVSYHWEKQAAAAAEILREAGAVVRVVKVHSPPRWSAAPGPERGDGPHPAHEEVAIEADCPLDRVPCARCGAVGRLVAELPEPAACPLCLSTVLVVTGRWFT